ncbi:MAG: SUMF1/EgtB/PvdO family nonheme iron enzyme, partial [Candidatus Riflebacteria bacterium]|nr:SUMF1/EgtB/PvdO family nonheme iron enzyme [Candidatus Riflebacteria bacterium]
DRWPVPPDRPGVVGSRPSGASFYGLLDMAGNVWEWCSDRYDVDYFRQPFSPDPHLPAGGAPASIRGGSFLSFAATLRCSMRLKMRSTDDNDQTGFRTVLSP